MTLRAPKVHNHAVSVPRLLVGKPRPNSRTLHLLVTKFGIAPDKAKAMLGH
jgi:hypothetical protein